MLPWACPPREVGIASKVWMLRRQPPHPPNSYCNKLFVHVDPHAIVSSSNSSLTLQSVASSIPAPYNENKVAVPRSSEEIWMANDGGVYHAYGANTD